MGRPRLSSDKVKDYTYRIRLDDEDERKLNELSKAFKTTKADIFRICIDSAYELVFNITEESFQE